MGRVVKREKAFIKVGDWVEVQKLAKPWAFMNGFQGKVVRIYVQYGNQQPLVIPDYEIEGLREYITVSSYLKPDQAGYKAEHWGRISGRYLAKIGDPGEQQ